MKIRETGKCAHKKDKEKPCKYAHYGRELNLVENADKIKNLTAVMDS